MQGILACLLSAARDWKHPAGIFLQCKLIVLRVPAVHSMSKREPWSPFSWMLMVIQHLCRCTMVTGGMPDNVCFLQYYFSPSGKKFRSRLEVGKALGIEEERKPKKTANAATPPADKGAAIPGGSELPTAARDDVLARVRASAAALNSTLPLALGNGLSLLRCAADLCAGCPHF